MNPNLITVAGNDEHGISPPTAGKRTPILPYVNRSFFENEFNRAAKIRFIAAVARCGFKTLDVHPELFDVSITERRRRVNNSDSKAVITFTYNATVQETFNAVNGTGTYYSELNLQSTASQRLATSVLDFTLATGVTNSIGTHDLNVGMLSSVNMPAALIEANFMTNYKWAALMNDPDWQTMVGEACARAICSFFSTTYIPQNRSNCPTLKRGANGSCVRYLQWMLAVYGYDVNAKDGVFGVNTENAVKKFQNGNSLTVDGIVGRNSWQLLENDFATSPTLSLGSRGVYGQRLQQKLLSKLYQIGNFNADGVFGSFTQSAVKAFQSERELPTTGIVDNATWRKIMIFDEARPRPNDN